MKVQKYILHGNQCNTIVSKRLGITPLTHSEQWVIYAIKSMHHSPTTYTLMRRAAAIHYTTREMTIHTACKSLEAKGLIERVESLWAITYLGRDYLYKCRNYLLNLRIK